MTGKVLGLVAISMLLSAVLVVALASEQTAEAKTSKDSPKHKFSKWSKKVCGDKMCTEGTHLRTLKRVGNGGPNN